MTDDATSKSQISRGEWIGLTLLFLAIGLTVTYGFELVEGIL